MNKCPFIAIRQITRETKIDADGKVIEQKETPAVELRECLGAECEIFDPVAGKCALPTIEVKIQRLEELQRALQEDASHAMLAELRESRETTAATLIHILRKADAANELLGRIAEPGATAAVGATGGGDVSALLAPLVEMKEALAISQNKFSDILELMLEDQQKRAQDAHAAASGDMVPAGPASVDLGPVTASLTEMKEALGTSNAKFTDILELMLEEQQKRAAQGAGPAPDSSVDLAPLQSGLAELKEALNLSQSKFSDILELMLEEQQRKAAEGAAVASALDKLAEKQEQLFGALAQQLQPAAGGQDWQRDLKTELAAMVGMIEQGVLRLADAENKRQAELNESARRIAELQQTMLTLLESQRAEQSASGDDRRRQQAEEHNEKGVMLYHRREPGAAEAEFRRAIEIRQDFAEAHNNLGLALSDQNKRDEAVAAFKRAVELLPDAPESYNNLGCLFKIKKDYQQAVEYFNQAIAKRADYSTGYFNLGLAYEEMEKFDPAIKAWEKVLALQPTHDEARRKIATYRARKV